MTPTLHVIGAGLAGLSCAVHAKQFGLRVKLYESTPKAGGRLRKVHDKINNQRYDNGTHLIIEGYKHTFDYLKLIGATKQLNAYQPAAFSFAEPAHNLTWQVPARHLGGQVLKGHIPGVGLGELWPLLKLILAKPETSLADILNDKRDSLSRFWEPLILAVFNTQLNEVSTRLLKQTLLELVKAGPNAFLPYFVENTLEDCFISPALDGLDISYTTRFMGVDQQSGKIHKLRFKNKDIDLNEGDKVVLALPPQAYGQIELPFGTPKMSYNAITNIHFFLDSPVCEKFLGLVGTYSQWVYAKDRHVCVTISDFTVPKGYESIAFAHTVWQEIAPYFSMDLETLPAHRIITENYATPRQDLEFQNERLDTKTCFSNLFLAGDWINTKLPATIESAIKSGKRAAVEVSKI